MYTVIVGNIGTIGEFESLEAARASFQEYVQMSVEGYGRSAGEPVYLFSGDELVDEHTGGSECQ